MSEIESIPGHQQVAAFLLSLDPKTARTVLRHIKRDVLEDVARAMVDLDPRLSEEGTVESLYRSLALSLHGPKRVSACPPNELGGLLETAVGANESKAILERIEARRRKERPFAAIERHPSARIARVVAGESAALGALVLGHVDPKKAAEIVAAMPEEKALEAVGLLAKLRDPSPGVVRVVAERLAGLLSALEAKGESAAIDRLQGIAEMLNNSSPQIEQKVMETIGAESAEMAATLREHMFTWEDIATIDKRSMQKILSTVDTKTLSVALKGASSGVEGNLMNNLSARVRDMVAEEREIAGAVSRTVIEDARNEIMRSIRAMIEAGEFKPSRGGEELVS